MSDRQKLKETTKESHGGSDAVERRKQPVELRVQLFTREDKTSAVKGSACSSIHNETESDRCSLLKASISKTTMTNRTSQTLITSVVMGQIQTVLLS